MRLRLLPEAVRALGVPSPRRLPLSSFFSHCQLKERERRSPDIYANIHAISELIDRTRTKRHPIFPIFFQYSSSLDYLSFLIPSIISIDPIDKRKVKFLDFKIFDVSVSTRFNVHSFPNYNSPTNFSNFSIFMIYIKTICEWKYL